MSGPRDLCSKMVNFCHILEVIYQAGNLDQAGSNKYCYEDQLLLYSGPIQGFRRYHIFSFIIFSFQEICTRYSQIHVLQLTFSLELGKNDSFVSSLRNQEFPQVQGIFLVYIYFFASLSKTVILVIENVLPPESFRGPACL